MDVSTTTESIKMLVFKSFNLHVCYLAYFSWYESLVFVEFIFVSHKLASLHILHINCHREMLKGTHVHDS